MRRELLTNLVTEISTMKAAPNDLAQHNRTHYARVVRAANQETQPVGLRISRHEAGKLFRRCRRRRASTVELRTATIDREKLSTVALHRQTQHYTLAFD